MPKYDYRCTECGHVYEKREGFDAPAVQACPECSAIARRVLTPPAIVFKGSGWYVTDHRKGSSESDSSSTRSNTKSDSPSTSSDGTAAAAKSESKSKSESTAKAD